MTLLFQGADTDHGHALPDLNIWSGLVSYQYQVSCKTANQRIYLLSRINSQGETNSAYCVFVRH